MSRPADSYGDTARPQRPPDAPQGEPFGGYVKTGLLGKGAFGEVWKAWDVTLSRWVALKLLRHEDEDELRRFVREAQTAAGLVHPNIAAIHQIGEHDGRHFIAMQFVDGRTLDKAVRRNPGEAARLVRDAARALAYAHERGVIHRDIKPANVMVDGASRVYVMDFGLARRTDLRSSISQSGMMLGTPAYMSPEQARGERADARSDVYSLGATLYELLAGRPPFKAESLYDLLARVVGEEPKPVPSVDADLGTIVMKCLAKDPAHRYAGAAALADDLSRYLEGEPIAAHPPSALYRIRKAAAKRRGVIAAAVLVLVAAIAIGAWARRGPEPAAPPPPRTKEAAAMLESARKEIEQGLQCRYQKATTAADLEKYAAAAHEWIVKAQQLVPHSAESHYLRGRALEVEGDDYRAAQSHREALRLDATLAPAHHALGMLLLAQALAGDSPDARVLAESARELSVSAVEGELRQKAREAALAYASGDAKSARRLAEEGLAAFDAAPGVEEFHLLIGATAHSDPERRAACTRALEVRPNFPLALVCRARTGDVNDRIDDCTAALRANPRCAPAYVIRGIARVLHRGEVEALLDLDEAVKLWPSDATFTSRACVRVWSLDWKGAAQDCERALAMDATSAEALHWRAHAREAQDDPAGADADIAEAARRSNRADHRLCRAKRLKRRGDLEGALNGTDDPLLRTCVLRDRGDVSAALDACRGSSPALHLLRASLRALSGDVEGAIEECSRAIALDPGGALAWLRRAELTGSVEDREEARRLDPDLAKSRNEHEVRGDVFEAIADYERSHAPSYRRLAEMHRSLGDSKALLYCNLALAVHPGDVSTLRRRGDLRLFAGDKQGAVDDYTKVIRVAPYDGAAWRGRALAFEKGDQALSDCEEALRSNPRDALAYRIRGHARRGSDNAGALKDLSESIRLNAWDPEAWRDRGSVRRDLNDMEAAFADYDQALKIDPRFLRAYLSKAEAYEKIRDWPNAIACHDEALRLSPDLPQALAYRAEDLEAKGDVAGALAGYERVLQVASPKFYRDKAQKGLARLRSR